MRLVAWILVLAGAAVLLWLRIWHLVCTPELTDAQLLRQSSVQVLAGAALLLGGNFLLMFLGPRKRD